MLIKSIEAIHITYFVSNVCVFITGPFIVDDK